MAKTPSERMEELAEAMKKLTDTDERLVKVQEKRLSDLKKTERKLESFENLGQQLRESLLAPLQGIARMIPAPLKILGKMAIAPIARPMLQASMAGQVGAAMPGVEPEGGGLFRSAMGEAMGREMSQRGIYKGAIATLGATVPGLSKLDRFSMTKNEPSTSGLMGMSAEGIIDRLIAIRGTLLGMASDLESLASAGAKEGSIFVHDARVEEKLEEIDENTEPPPASQVSETELEAKKPAGFLGKLKGVGKKGWLSGFMRGGLGRLLPWLLGLMTTLATSLAAAGGFAMTALAGLGPFILPAAIIAWGLYGVVKVIKDMFTGFDEGGLSGAIAKIFGGEEGGKGLWNSIKTALKLGGLGAAIGGAIGGLLVPGLGAIPGALIGGLIGMAIGAITGYIGHDRIKSTMDKAGKAVASGWNIMVAWLNDMTSRLGAWIYTGASIGSHHPGTEHGIKIFGVEIPPLPTEVSDLIDKAWKALTGWVTSIGNWFWDENGKMFGGRFDPNFKMEMPDFTIPDFSAIGAHVAQKFKQKVAVGIDLIPNVLLPKYVEEWIAENREPVPDVGADAGTSRTPDVGADAGTSRTPFFQHWDSGGGQDNQGSVEYYWEGVLRQRIPGFSMGPVLDVPVMSPSVQNDAYNLIGPGSAPMFPSSYLDASTSALDNSTTNINTFNNGAFDLQWAVETGKENIKQGIRSGRQYNQRAPSR